MKEYCTNCGYANEYAGKKPDHCAKCKTKTGVTLKVPTQTQTQSNNVMTKLIKPNLTPAPLEVPDATDFGTYMDFEPEQISQGEIENIFLGKGSKSINLKDLMKEGQASMPKEPTKKKGRSPKKK
jgi:hypothetical protein